jgi:hypothetical protein
VAITVRPLHPLFCAGIGGVDTGEPMNNRATLHRATACDTVRHKRLMQRTTIRGDGPTVAQPEQYELAAE